MDEEGRAILPNSLNWKYEVEYLDLVTIRSCQMACEGCCTFSDHKEINGLVEPADIEESLAFWSKLVYPKRLHLFGGEPTMHPRLLEWYRLAVKYWPKTKEGFPTAVWLNTNGYFLQNLFPHVEELFVDGFLSLSVTHHTLMEPYASLTQNNYDQLKQLILEANIRRAPTTKFTWVTDTPWDSEYKKFSKLTDDQGRDHCLLNICYQHQDHFVPHYKGHGPTLEPWAPYNDTEAKLFNHKNCHIKNYVQFYNGRLYKCPPRAVLNQTLETYGLENSESWADYYDQYKSVGMDNTPDEIDQWFKTQKEVENTCNMCGFMHSHEHFPAQEHLPKKLFKIKPIEA